MEPVQLRFSETDAAGTVEGAVPFAPDLGAGLLRHAAEAGATPVSEGVGEVFDVEEAEGVAVADADADADEVDELVEVGDALGVGGIDPGPKPK